jgi:hypothetical protein
MAPMLRPMRILSPKELSRTFSVETRSAVSRSVNWLIWSTMAEILGFVGAAASVDCHLRAVRCCASEAGAALRTGEEERALQTQRLRARAAGADMTGGGNGER